MKLEKQDFYHGCAIIQLLDDTRLNLLKKHKHGYLANDAFIFLKYSTRNRDPWQFTFSVDDLKHLHMVVPFHRNMLVAMICGGDGICATNWSNIESLVGANAGQVIVRRKFGGQYDLHGSRSDMQRKIPRNDWPDIVFRE